MTNDDEWQRAAARTEVRTGEVLGVRIGETAIALIELAGQVHAIGDVCPHAYALLSQGWLDGGEIECPLHAARFDIASGRCLEGPVTEGVAVYEVRVDGDDVYVRIAWVGAARSNSLSTPGRGPG